MAGSLPCVSALCIDQSYFATPSNLKVCHREEEEDKLIGAMLKKKGMKKNKLLGLDTILDFCVP